MSFVLANRSGFVPGSFSATKVDEAKDVIFCHVSVTTVRLGRMKSSHNLSPAFVISRPTLYL